MSPRRRALWALQGWQSRAALHGALDADEERQEVGRAAVGRRAVLGPGLAEAGHVLGDGEVAGHADLLPAADAHAVDAADGRLVAVQDGRDHVVEEAHVRAVARRVARVDRGVLARVAARAEGAVPGTGKDRGDNRRVLARATEGEDDLADRARRVGVQLLGVVEHDPRGEEAFDLRTVGAPHRPLLVADRLESKLRNQLVLTHGCLPGSGPPAARARDRAGPPGHRSPRRGAVARPATAFPRARRGRARSREGRAPDSSPSCRTPRRREP